MRLRPPTTRRDRFGAIALAVVLVGATAAVGWRAVIQPALLPPEPAMPPLSADLLKLQDYYKFRFLPDGYPGKLADGTVTAQPIYGRYVIADYLRQYAESPTPALRDAILKVAHAAIARMDSLKDALVFWYPPELGISRQPKRHYSGLTQAYYAQVLHEAYRATGDEGLLDASQRTFRSLLIPSEEGGVLYEWEDGVAVAEVPTAPRDLILNGWLSILAAVHDYADQTGSTEARDLFDRSAATAAKLLPLYDSPELRNSRYGLTGPLRLRIGFDGPTDGVEIDGLRVDIPKEGSFAIPVAKLSRWEFWADAGAARATANGFAPTESNVTLNVVLSRLPHPQENVVRFTIDAPRAMTVALSAYVGHYDPLSTDQTGETWQPVMSVPIPMGRTDVDIALPWSMVDLFAYPTNFLKKIEGRNTNVYHVIHVLRLRSMQQWTGDPVFGQWADTWQRYVCDWASMPLYDGLSVRDYRTDSSEIAADPDSFCS